MGSRRKYVSGGRDAKVEKPVSWEILTLAACGLEVGSESKVAHWSFKNMYR